jgi:hypothetical protein
MEVLAAGTIGMNDTDPLEITLDEMIHHHGIASVLQALAIACEFENDQAHDAWEGPEGAFDPVWLRLAGRIRQVAKSAESISR